MQRAYPTYDEVEFCTNSASPFAAPQTLRNPAMPRGGMARRAELAAADPYPNPRLVKRDSVDDLPRRVWAAKPPRP